MPAYFESGFCVRQPSWHGKETLLADYPESWDEARMSAGLMWEPTYLDLFVPRMIPAGQAIPDGAEVVFGDKATIRTTFDEGADGRPENVVRWAVGATKVHVPVDGHRAIARDDTMEVLATPTDSFNLIYHHQMGGLLDAYVETMGKAGGTLKFETAGSVRGGRNVYAVVYLDEPWHAPGDESRTYPYAVLLNAHDGSGACKLITTNVRVVCWNTYQAADSDGQNALVIRHTASASDRVENAKVALGAMRDEAEAWRMQAEDLASINVDDALVRTFLDDFIPIPEGATERGREGRRERQATFMGLDNGPTCGDLPPTAYRLVQAAGEYLDHVRPYRSADTYLSRTMFGTDAKLKAGTIRRIRDLATAGA
jgi:phage/plasmid-like protein (TIGR03299 family)